MGQGEGVVSSGADMGPKGHALPALSVFSFKLAFLLLQLGLSVFSTNGLCQGKSTINAWKKWAGGGITVDMARNGSTMVFFYRKIDKKFCAVLLLR